jgi:predicted nucleic acid-binding Zn ribbon protein
MGIGDAMKGYLSRSGLRERLEQTGVLDEWPRLVGPQIAQVTSPQTVTKDGTLFVGVASAAWMQELQLMTPTVLARLGERSKAIKRIVWRAE